MKMKITYAPETRAAQEWVVDRGNPDFELAYLIETETGWGLVEFIKRLDGMSVIAWRALLWALRKTCEDGEPRLPIESVTVDWKETTWDIECPLCGSWVKNMDHDCDLSALAAAADDKPEDDNAKAGGGGPEA